MCHWYKQTKFLKNIIIWALFFFFLLANAITAFQTVYSDVAHGTKHSHDVSKHPF